MRFSWIWSSCPPSKRWGVSENLGAGESIIMIAVMVKELQDVSGWNKCPYVSWLSLGDWIMELLPPRKFKVGMLFLHTKKRLQRWFWASDLGIFPGSTHWEETTSNSNTLGSCRRIWTVLLGKEMSKFSSCDPTTDKQKKMDAKPFTINSRQKRKKWSTQVVWTCAYFNDRGWGFRVSQLQTQEIEWENKKQNKIKLN